MTLPALVYSGLTKTGNEMHVFVHKWPGRMSAQRTLLSTGVTSFDYQLGCGQGAAYTCTEELSILTSCGNHAVGSAAPLGIPANSPIYTAMDGWTNPAGIGDSLLLVEVPCWEERILVCYDQGGSPTPGLPFRPIARKFNPVDHYVRTRPENRITLSELFVSNWDGLQQVKGCPCSIILGLMPSGAGAYQEIHYYGNVLLNPNSFNWGAEGNDSQTISLEGSFSFCAILSAAKP